MMGLKLLPSGVRPSPVPRCRERTMPPRDELRCHYEITTFDFDPLIQRKRPLPAGRGVFCLFASSDGIGLLSASLIRRARGLRFASLAERCG